MNRMPIPDSNMAKMPISGVETLVLLYENSNLYFVNVTV